MYWCWAMGLRIGQIYKNLSLSKFHNENAKTPSTTYGCDSPWQYHLMMRHSKGMVGMLLISTMPSVVYMGLCVRHPECYLSFSQNIGQVKGHTTTPLGITLQQFHPLNQNFPIWWYIQWAAVLVIAPIQWSIINYTELF